MGLITAKVLEERLELSRGGLLVSSLAFLVNLLGVLVLPNLLRYASSEFAIIPMDPLHIFPLLHRFFVFISINYQVLPPCKVSRAVLSLLPTAWLVATECEETCLHPFEDLDLKS